MNRWFVRRALTVTVLLAALTAASAADTLQRIQKQGVLKWGADAEGGAPYVYPDPDHPERLIGFEADLADALAKKIGVRAEMVQNQWDGLVPALQRGDFDIILNGLEITDEHRLQIAMSRPYYAYTQQIVTRRATTNLTRLEDLKGKVVGTLSGSVAQRLLEQLGGTDVRLYPGQVEPFRELNNGRIDAVVLDRPIVLFCLQKEPGLTTSGEPFAVGYYGIGVKQEDKTLLAAMNQALTELHSDGTLEKIYTRYGLWDTNQTRLATYHEESVAAQKRISTLREWHRYLPRLLRGALITVELSVISMVMAMFLGLILA